MTATPQPQTAANIQQVIPFFRIAEMDRSLRFYLDGLGFTLKNKWVVEGKIRWCMLEIGGAALMLQTFEKEDGSNPIPAEKLGVGASLVFQCADAVALYREFVSRGLAASEPEVGNNMWVTGITDPDGYRLEFASFTDVPEDTKLSELKT
jgi:lactoylglutathione lyase